MKNKLIQTSELKRIQRILFTVPLVSDDNEHLLKQGFSFALYLAESFSAVLTTLVVLEDLSPSAQILVSKFLTKKERLDLKMKNEAEVLEKTRKSAIAYCMETIETIENCPLISNDIVVEMGSMSSVIEKIGKDMKSDLILLSSGGNRLGESLVKRTGAPVMLLPLSKKD